jgi:hypothetical protein
MSHVREQIDVSSADARPQLERLVSSCLVLYLGEGSSKIWDVCADLGPTAEIAMCTAQGGLGYILKLSPV